VAIAPKSRDTRRQSANAMKSNGRRSSAVIEKRFSTSRRVSPTPPSGPSYPCGGLSAPQKDPRSVSDAAWRQTPREKR